MATTSSNDICSAMGLMTDAKLTATQRSSVQRIVAAWRASGRSHSVAVDDGDLAVLRAIAAKCD